MQNANEFAKTTSNIPALSNYPVDLNDPFCVAVALQFISENLSHLPITLVSTVYSGYNSYMLLNIPAEHVENFFGPTSFNNDPDEFIPLENDVYAVYSCFPDISNMLTPPIDVDTF
jgi:hypothetical protein